MGFFSGNTGRLFLVNVMTAVSYAFILPVMSLFLINGLHASPIFITFYSLALLLFCINRSHALKKHSVNG